MIGRLVKKYPLLRELALYGIIGLTSAGIDSGAFAMLRRLDANLYLANFIGVNIGIVCSFLLNTYLNFRVTDHLWKRAISFWCVGYCGMGLSMIILYCGVTVANLHEFAVKIASVFIVAAFQFVLNKLITYRRAKTNG